MRRVAVLLLAAFVAGAVGGGGAARAATFTPILDLNLGTPGGCPAGFADDRSGGSATGYCNGPGWSYAGEAHVEGGELRVGASVNGTIPAGFAGFVMAYAGYQDEVVITSGPEEGFLRLDLQVEGFGTSSGTASQPWINYGFNEPAPGEGVAENFTGSYDETISFDVPYENGLASFWVYIETAFSCGVGACSGTSDFLNTAKIIDAAILDTAMNLVPDAKIEAASGFDYLAASQPVSEIPLPPSLVLFGGGLSLMLLAGRRRAKGAVAA